MTDILWYTHCAWGTIETKMKLETVIAKCMVAIAIDLDSKHHSLLSSPGYMPETGGP